MKKERKKWQTQIPMIYGREEDRESFVPISGLMRVRLELDWIALHLHGCTGG